MKETTQDRRTRKTRKLYENALITLLKTRDINKITVTDISKMVNMNRGTFYIHYDNVYDLLESIQNNLMTEFEQLTNLPPSEDKVFMFEAAFSRILQAVEFVDQNRELFTTLLNDKGSLIFVSRVKKLFSEKLLVNFSVASSEVNKKYSGVFGSFFISGLIGVIQEWLDNDPDISAFELASIIHMLLKENINNMR